MIIMGKYFVIEWKEISRYHPIQRRNEKIQIAIKVTFPTQLHYIYFHRISICNRNSFQNIQLYHPPISYIHKYIQRSVHHIQKKSRRPKVKEQNKKKQTLQVMRIMMYRGRSITFHKGIRSSHISSS